MSGSALPSVTVLICAHDYERWVAEAIESALGQDYAGEIEVLVVDDGSTDRTPEVLRGFGDAIRVIRQDNAGLNAATARGIAEARGELVALLDADDAWRPDKLRRQVALLVERPEVGLVYSDKEIVDAEGRRLHPSFFAHHGITPVRGRAVGPLLRHNAVPAPTIVFRRALAGHVLPFPDEVAAQDWWLAVRIAQVAELECVPLPLTRYRVHGANMGVGTAGDEHFARLVRRDNRFRRWMLRRLDLDGATLAEIGAAWETYVKGLGFVAQELGPEAAEELVSDADRAEHRRLIAEAQATPDPARAARLLAAACAADPTDAAGAAALAALLQADAAGQGAVAPEPAGVGPERVDWAEERFAAGDSQAAVAALIAVASESRQADVLARAHGDLAVIAYGLGDAAAAGDAALAALSHDSAHAGALEVLAGCAEAEGDLPAAAHWLRRMLAVAPGDPGALRSLARCEHRRGRFAAAGALLRQAAGQGPLPAAEEQLQEAVRRRLEPVVPTPAAGKPGRLLLVVDRLAPEPDAGGRRAEALGEALARAGWRVEIACRAPQPPTPLRGRHRGMAVHGLSGNTVAALTTLVRRGRHDAVVAISEPSAWPVAAVLMLPRPRPRVVVQPLLTEAADGWLRGSPQALGEYRALVDGADAVVVESLGGRDARLHEDLGVSAVHLPALPAAGGEAPDGPVALVAGPDAAAVRAAMRAGVAWVATVAAAEPEAAGGLLVPADELEAAAEHVLADPAAGARLGAAGRAHWEAGLGGDALLARWDAVLRGTRRLPDVVAPAAAAAVTDAALGAFLDARAVAIATSSFKDAGAMTRTRT